jgi:hypothetical protein
MTMKRTVMTCGLVLLAGCSSSSSGGSPGDDGSADDGSGNDGSGQDGTTTPDTGGNDAPSEATSPDASDAAHADATDGGGGGDADATTSDGPTSDGSSDGPTSEGSTPDGSLDGSADGSCPTTWLEAPTASVNITPDAGVVILHALGSGTQDYACLGTPIDGGADAGDAGATFKWTLVAPDAVLSDCNGNAIGHHFASEAGATAPEWLTFADGTYVIGQKVNSYTPDGGGGSIPWLLIQGVAHGGAGPLSTVTYVQRLDTDGGLAPTTGCDFDASGATTDVPYTADYYFFGP